MLNEEIEKELFEFKIAFASIVPKDRVKETTKAVSELRSNEWFLALKKANGDLAKAAVIFSLTD